jgi:hypothetical protein
VGHEKQGLNARPTAKTGEDVDQLFLVRRAAGGKQCVLFLIGPAGVTKIRLRLLFPSITDLL